MDPAYDGVLCAHCTDGVAYYDDEHGEGVGPCGHCHGRGTCDCARCGWPLCDRVEDGCTRDSCSCRCSRYPHCRCGVSS